MSAKREMQVVNNMAPLDIDALFGYEPPIEDRNKFDYLAVEETPGAPAQAIRYIRLGYEIVTVVCEVPRVTIMRIPKEKRVELFEQWAQAARDQSRAADMAAKAAVSGEGTPIGEVKPIDTGKVMTLPAG